ncbi:AcrB/AcrD/AcrF family protein [Sphingomonas abietis]|uniref:AcrB/AcrD/AcrF family protein n=1 Tax=Sphingomonas abietis TaxID=3012344 RepID=A0ABY7NQ06_9SPHN|nr:AcrB/AcrD/AcrF family protein [Sphingomonas abietis]WBO22693.1 AcrB/AcrD/AcrF family protein [Sphingomonas abietis]
MERLERWAEDLIDRRWKLVTFGFWVVVAIVLLVQKANAIHWLALSDTDDNMRFDQVRDWLAGQGWYDLRQYRMNPPGGFSIHWSRLVDLPLAGLILLFQPIVGTQLAYRWACAVAPMLPMLLAMLMSALTVRRLIGPRAYVLGLPLLLCAGYTMGMWSPLRIDHHGWQLAFLMTTVAGLTEPDKRKSGIIIALSSALSLAIGLEMLPYVAFAGAAVALHWAWDAAETPRIRSYGASLAVATILCFLVFASNDNWHPVCDVLSPVWMTTVASAAVLLLAISFVPAPHRAIRLLLVIVAGGIAGAIYVIGFPQCFGHRLEGIPPEADRLWLSHVSEARPIYMHPIGTFVDIAAMPFVGSIGALVAMIRRWGTRAAAEWAPVTLFTLFATALLFWQIRTAPSAEMLAVSGAAYIALWGFVQLRRSSSVLVRVIGPVAAFLIASGLLFTVGLDRVPDRFSKLKVANLWAIASGREAWPAAPKPGGKPKPDLTSLANRRCMTIPSLAPIGKLPPALFFTMIDNGPRLITLTHHSAVGGPYHRNWRAILDIEHAFRGTPDQAHAIIDAHHAQYLLLCPHMSEATIYQAEAPAGFYAKLQSGWTPNWLARQPLPANSPYQLWKVVG